MLPFYEDTLGGKRRCATRVPARTSTCRTNISPAADRPSTESRRPSVDSARAVLRLSDVVKTFPGVVALKGVSLEVAEGEVHALVGENGAGKSTLMAVAAGSTLPDSGTVEIGGQPLDEPSPAARAGARARRRLPAPSILDDLTVAENMLARVPTRRRPSTARATGVDARAARSGRRGISTRAARVDRAQRRRPPAARDRQGARARAEGARARRADRVADAGRERAALRADPRASRERGTAVVYISHRLPEVQAASPTGSPCSATARCAARSRRPSVSEDEILRSDHRPRRSSRSSRRRPAAAEEADAAAPRRRPAAAPASTTSTLDVAAGRDRRPRRRRGQRPARVPARARRSRARRRARCRWRAPRSRWRARARAQAAGIVYLPGDRHAEGVLLLALRAREHRRCSR